MSEETKTKEKSKMSKLQLTDNMMDAVMKMSNGNPGAISAIMDIMEKHQEIDPQAAMGAMGLLLALDDQGIYGTAIYVLWSDKCGKDTRRLLMLMRASQLGLFPRSKIFEMSQDQRYEINLTEEEFMELDKKVTDELEDFQKIAA